MTKMTTLCGNPLSPLAFGTMQFGGRADAIQSRAMFDACRGAGINHFDTANVYNDGAAETLLGEFCTSNRADAFIATKVGYIGGSNPANISVQFDACRKRLNVESVDLLYIHLFDPETVLEETFGKLARMQSDGLIRHIGISNYSAWQATKAQWTASKFGTCIDAIQPMYSLVKRQAEVEILPMAVDQNMSVFSYSPLGGGVLTGKYQSNPGDGRLNHDAQYAKRYAGDHITDTAAKLSELAADLSVPPATLAVSWAMQHPAIAAPIISARSAQQLAPSLDAANFTMAPDLYERISALSPSPPPATDRTETQ